MTVIGLQIRYLLGGVVVIERIFGIQGLGSLAVDAAFARDYPTVMATTDTMASTRWDLDLGSRSAIIHPKPPEEQSDDDHDDDE